MKRVNASIADKLQNKFNTSKETAPAVQVETETYISVINYDTYELTEKERDTLIGCEKEAVRHGQAIAKSTMELSKIFCKAQETLASKKTGSFYNWFEQLGFKKDFVYMCLKRNDLYLKFKDEKVFDLPERTVKAIAKVKDTVDARKLKNAIHAEKPLEAVKIIMSGSPTNTSENLSGNMLKDTEIEEAEIVYADEEKKAAKIRISEIDAELKEIERRREHLKFERDMLSKRI